MVKNLPAMWETWVQSLSWEDPLEEGMETHFIIPDWRIPQRRLVVYNPELKSRTWLSDEHTHRLQSGKKQGCLLWPQLLNDVCNFLKNANKRTLKINTEKEVSYAMIVYLESYNLCGTQVALVVKNLPANEQDLRDAGSVPGLGRSSGEGNGDPLQYSCLENPMDRGTWRVTVHRVTKSQTRLMWLHTHTIIVYLESLRKLVR